MPPGKKTHILLAEDDKFLIEIYQRKLENQGFIVLLAFDGNKVLEILEKEKIDLILLDIMLPGINGFDLLETMNKHKQWATIPVIIHTNLGQDKDIEKAKQLGAKDYLIKANVSTKEVVERIKKILKIP